MPRTLPVLDAPAATRVPPRAVRISVTDRCDMACVYCRPSRRDGYLAAERRLDLAAWERMLRGLVAAGIRRVRITGGEPLLNPDVVGVVAAASRLGVDDLALTTNASRLVELAAPLRRAGLRRLNVSIDSLDRARFAQITRGADLDIVLAGLRAARAAGFDEIKTNTVVLRGINDDELPAITEWAWSQQITPRFLEVMGVGEGARIVGTSLVPYNEMRRALASLIADDTEAAVEPDRGPARYVRSRDGRHRVGFITGTSDTFCGGCDRLRAGSDGLLRPCLARNDGVAAGDVLQGEGSEQAVASRLAEAWALKPDASWKGCTEVSAADVSMRATGG